MLSAAVFTVQKGEAPAQKQTSFSSDLTRKLHVSSLTPHLIWNAKVSEINAMHTLQAALIDFWAQGTKKNVKTS